MAQLSALIVAFMLVLSPLGLTATPATPATPASLPGDKPSTKPKTSDKQEKPLTKQQRLAFIQAAQVWRPTTVADMDLRAGPQGSGAFPPDAVVNCNYVPTKPTGSSRKFDCVIDETDVVKVRYGIDNGEVYGSVLGSRLLWALGFGADRVYPVTVVCRGCSVDPWTSRAMAKGEQTFDPAVIERKPEGHSVNADFDSGWGWTELNLVDPSKGGASRAQRDALTLLASFMQHTDSKPEQQRLVCLSNVMTDGTCGQPFLAVHDVGLTFGHGNYANRTATGSVNLVEWQRTSVWRDPVACIAHLSRSRTGTLGDPKISEAGRAFLSDLLAQLSDEQLRDLFEVARVDFRSRQPNADVSKTASVDEWVAAFKHKRDEIVTNHCPD